MIDYHDFCQIKYLHKSPGRNASQIAREVSWYAITGPHLWVWISCVAAVACTLCTGRLWHVVLPLGVGIPCAPL
jgi:hypothetical protein